jgi:hypothetical protein
MNLIFDPMSARPGRELRTASMVVIALCLLVFPGCGRSDNPLSDVSSPSPAPASSANATADRSYHYGTKITFGVSGNAALYKVSGWSSPEAESTWTEGQSAKLAFTVPPANNPITFKAVVSGFVKPPDLPSQPVTVLINGQQVAQWDIAAKGVAQMDIPAQFTQNGRLELEFRLPKATSPSALGMSIDQRILGMCFYELELTAP